MNLKMLTRKHPDWLISKRSKTVYRARRIGTDTAIMARSPEELDTALDDLKATSRKAVSI